MLYVCVRYRIVSSLMVSSEYFRLLSRLAEEEGDE